MDLIVHFFSIDVVKYNLIKMMMSFTLKNFVVLPYFYGFYGFVNLYNLYKLCNLKCLIYIHKIRIHIYCNICGCKVWKSFRIVKCEITQYMTCGSDLYIIS